MHSKKKITGTVIIAIVTIIIVVIGVTSKKKEDNIANKICHTYIEINEAALAIEKQYTENGVVEIQDVSSALDELSKLAEQYKKNGVVLDYQRQSTSLYFQLANGIGYLYSLSVDKMLTGSGKGGILTIEPGGARGEFDDFYQLIGTNPDEMAKKIVDTFPDNYMFSIEDDWDSLSFKQISEMGNHKIIIWYGHGGYTKEYGPVLATSVPVEQATVNQYMTELENGEVLLAKDCFCVTPSYFEKNIQDGTLDGSLIILAACDSVRDERLANVFHTKGASLVVGSSHSIHVDYMLNMLDDFVTALLNQYDDNTYWTAEDALKYARTENGEVDSGYNAEVKLVYPENKKGYCLYSYENHANSNSFFEESNEDVTLSETCDKIIYSIRDEEDYYEFVVNEEISYPQNTYQFGVIKNNEWLVPMSSQSPFLNEDNSWKSLEDINSNPLDEICFEYLGEGCFLYYVDYYNTNINSSGIIYNPTTNVSLPVLNMAQYDNLKNIVAAGQIVVMNRSFEWVLLNTTTGETNFISGYFQKDGEWRVERIQGISEGLFMARIKDFGMTTKYITGFFNVNGELIVDLSEYGYPDKENDYRYNNGQCEFITHNDTGLLFKITIDKSGKIIAQEKIQN